MFFQQKHVVLLLVLVVFQLINEGMGHDLSLTPKKHSRSRNNINRLTRSVSDRTLMINHDAIKNFLPETTESESFDMWARAMRLDDGTSLNMVEASPLSQGHPQNNTELVAQVGGTATLSCFTGHMADEMVTWLKREDDQLLTVGQQVYVSEERLKVSQSHRTKAWELFVQDVHLSDAGQYECQLTTHPPVSYFFTLIVTQAVASVTGTHEVHIEEGSQLALECQVQKAPVPPIYIFWYHNGTMVNYNQNLIVRTENFTSTLVVSKVTRIDAGIYTCEPQLATPANVTVHVVTGERPAAMQHGHSSGSSPSTSRSAYTIFAPYYLPAILALLLLAHAGVTTLNTKDDIVIPYSKKRTNVKNNCKETINDVTNSESINNLLITRSLYIFKNKLAGSDSAVLSSCHEKVRKQNTASSYNESSDSCLETIRS